MHLCYSHVIRNVLFNVLSTSNIFRYTCRSVLMAYISLYNFSFYVIYNLNIKRDKFALNVWTILIYSV